MYNNYNFTQLTEHLKELDKCKHDIRKQLGRIGIMLPKKSGLKEVLFSVYFYYMYNLFGNENIKWKEKYFPLDGIELFKFIEEEMEKRQVIERQRKENGSYEDVNLGDANKKYRDISAEILPIIYNGNTENPSGVTFDRGKLKKFNDYKEVSTEEYKTINDDLKVDNTNLLSNTKNMIKSIHSILLWKNIVTESMKRNLDKTTLNPNISVEHTLNKVLEELKKEPSFELPTISENTIILDKNKLKISHEYMLSRIQFPYTIYSKIESSIYNNDADNILRFIVPSLFNYKDVEFYVENIKSNTQFSTYQYNQYYSDRYRYYGTELPKDGSVYRPKKDSYSPMERTFNQKQESWVEDKRVKVKIPNLSASERVLLRNYDKYDGVYLDTETFITPRSFLGWKPKVLLYSKNIKTKNNDKLTFTTSNTSNNELTGGAIDSMNLLSMKSTGNLGMTIMVPELVEKYINEPYEQRGLEKIIQDYNSGDYRRSILLDGLSWLERDEQRKGLTYLLVGIFPVDKNNKVRYEDPISFEYLNRNNLYKDLGKSFTNYINVNNKFTKNKTYEKEYYPLKIGQLFYRNEYSQYQRSRDFTLKEPSGKQPYLEFSETLKVGDKSKNLLYLFGKDFYMNKVGKTSIPSGDNFNIVNPDDNTNLTTISIPKNTEYTFSKYGTTKIAIQLFVGINDSYNMSSENKQYNFFDLFENDVNKSVINGNNGRLGGSFLGVPYRESDNTLTIYDDTNTAVKNKVLLPNMVSKDGQSWNSLSYNKQLAYCTEPVIIDSEASDANNAPWLDEINAPYIFRVVTQNEGVDIYLKEDSNEKEHWDPGIYIKIPDIFSRYLFGEFNLLDTINEKIKNKNLELSSNSNTEKFKAYIENLYGDISDTSIQALASALLGVRINYNPTKVNSSSNKSKSDYRDDGNSILYTDPENFGVKVTKSSGVLLWIKNNNLDLDYAGLGVNSTIKVQLLFRNDFFRSSDPNSPLNYDYVPVTGEVKLLKEIAGQRIKLYRGGRMVHPTDYKILDDKIIKTTRIDGKVLYLLDNNKEVILSRNYNKGILRYVFNNRAKKNDKITNELKSTTISELEVADSVFDVISIEMDRPHWQQLLTSNNIHALNSLETDINNPILPFPMNLSDIENLDLFMYNIKTDIGIFDGLSNDSYSQNNYKYSDKFRPKLYTSENNYYKVVPYFDIYRYLIFWYVFRPKVKFSEDSDKSIPNRIDIQMNVETKNEWISRIVKENKAYFNRSKVKFKKFKLDGNRINERIISSPYYIGESSSELDGNVEIEDIFNIKMFYSGKYLSREQLNVARESKSNLYDIFYQTLGSYYLGDANFINNSVGRIPNGKNKKARFGGWQLERLLFSDWIFSYRQGDNKEIDEKIRLIANDVALDFFRMFCQLILNFRKSAVNNNYGYNNFYLQNYKIQDIFKEIIRFMRNYKSEDYNYSYELQEIIKKYQNIFLDTDVVENITNKERLMRYSSYASGLSNVYSVYGDNGSTSPTNSNVKNILNKRFYKGDNGRITGAEEMKNIRRGFRMGKNTPDNPFMGFSMPATSDVNEVPDHIHLVYCDIKWSDFDKSTNFSKRAWSDSYPNRFSRLTADTYRQNDMNTQYDFSNIVSKFKLNEWANKNKHIIFRILPDIPSDISHRDCPNNITGTEYENELGKGFMPNFNDLSNRNIYTLAIMCFIKWLNERFNSDRIGQFIYNIEIGIGHNNYGYDIIDGKKIYNKNLVDIFSKVIRFLDDSGIDDGGNVNLRNFSSNYNMKIPNSILTYNQSIITTCVPNLGNKKDFDMWIKANIIANTTENDYHTFIDNESDSNKLPDGFNHKFKKDMYYTGIIRNDLPMEELMKQDNFRDLLYCFRTITPMYVIGYVDKEKYPEQYELLMEQMGYKITITSVEFENGKIIVNYSNEGKNNPFLIERNNNLLRMGISTKGLINKDDITNFTFVKSYPSNEGKILNQENNANMILDNDGINQGGTKIFDAIIQNGNVTDTKDGYNKVVQNPKLSEQYGKNQIVDVYLSIYITLANGQVPINLANVNRDKKINLTDSGMLKNFINPDENSTWLIENILGNFKMDKNGWI